MLAEFVFGKDDEHTQTELVVHKNAPEDIARAINEILVNLKKVKTVTNIARTMVVKNYGLVFYSFTNASKSIRHAYQAVLLKWMGKAYIKTAKLLDEIG